MVLDLVAAIGRAMLEIESKFQKLFTSLSYRFENLIGMMNDESETAQSPRVFYLISLVLLISLIFLSPDRILQVLPPFELNSGLLEKIQDMVRLLRKFTPI